MARNLLGPIPDDHFENEPGPVAKNVTPLSQALLDWIELLKNNGTDKYKPDDEVGGY